MQQQLQQDPLLLLLFDMAARFRPHGWEKRRYLYLQGVALSPLQLLLQQHLEGCGAAAAAQQAVPRVLNLCGSSPEWLLSRQKGLVVLQRGLMGLKVVAAVAVRALQLQRIM
jgi:hypothetical protein